MFIKAQKISQESVLPRKLVHKGKDELAYSGWCWAFLAPHIERISQQTLTEFGWQHCLEVGHLPPNVEHSRFSTIATDDKSQSIRLWYHTNLIILELRYGSWKKFSLINQNFWALSWWLEMEGAVPTLLGSLAKRACQRSRSSRSLRIINFITYLWYYELYLCLRTFQVALLYKQ